MLHLLAATIITGNAYVNTSSSVTNTNGQVTSKIESNVQSSGGSEASAEVHNSVESSSGNSAVVTRHTEVTVNGTKKVIDSTAPGTDTIQIGSSPTPSPSQLPTATPVPAHLSPPPARTKPIDPQRIERYIMNRMMDFFSRLLPSKKI